jgi:hypothetical protein
MAIMPDKEFVPDLFLLIPEISERVKRQLPARCQPAVHRAESRRHAAVRRPGMLPAGDGSRTLGEPEEEADSLDEAGIDPASGRSQSPLSPRRIRATALPDS